MAWQYDDDYLIGMEVVALRCVYGSSIKHHVGPNHNVSLPDRG